MVCSYSYPAASLEHSKPHSAIMQLHPPLLQQWCSHCGGVAARSTSLGVVNKHRGWTARKREESVKGCTALSEGRTRADRSQRTRQATRQVQLQLGLIRLCSLLARVQPPLMRHRALCVRILRAKQLTPPQAHARQHGGSDTAVPPNLSPLPCPSRGHAAALARGACASLSALPRPLRGG